MENKKKTSPAIKKQIKFLAQGLQQITDSVNSFQNSEKILGRWHDNKVKELERKIEDQAEQIKSLFMTCNLLRRKIEPEIKMKNAAKIVKLKPVEQEKYAKKFLEQDADVWRQTKELEKKYPFKE